MLDKVSILWERIYLSLSSKLSLLSWFFVSSIILEIFWLLNESRGIIEDDNRLEHAVNIPNNNFIEHLPNDIVVEVPAVINKKGANGKKLDNYPKTFGALLNSQTGVIQLTTEAILNKSKHGAYLALLSDPIVDDAIKAEKLLNTMINKQSKFLGYLNWWQI